MAKVFCQNHQDQNLQPAMINFTASSLGRQYVCCVCNCVRVFNTGKITTINGQYGFISVEKTNFFFHFKNLAYSFIPSPGMPVRFEVSFLEDGRTQAVKIKPIKGENNGNNGN